MAQIIRAVQAAQDLLNDIGWGRPGDVSLDEIASSIGAIVEVEALEGCEGRIIMSKTSAIIKLNASITHRGKLNFVLAHEIGHFVLHRGLKLFVDNSMTLSEWHTKGAHEQEANAFAEELLMPNALFTERFKGKKLNIGLIEQLAEYFSVSLTAALIRYCRIGHFPIMVIFIDDGVIKWKMNSKDFSFPYLPYGTRVPAWTVAGDFFSGKPLENKPVQVDAIEWFPDDFKLRDNAKRKLWEQCFRVSQKGLMVCLWS
ncbi:ImmA/IrrE family metallo-endopeptidase [Flaviaesturariibacter amylovorans]|uniref:ImmA/IrrE family metallo-endopeptidase n=1 Tax=Flaviaesturariibacter amylovorans TaxID=1084520 RepID=A0ABP8H6Q8_9BACT